MEKPESVKVSPNDDPLTEVSLDDDNNVNTTEVRSTTIAEKKISEDHLKKQELTPDEQKVNIDGSTSQNFEEKEEVDTALNHKNIQEQMTFFSFPRNGLDSIPEEKLQKYPIVIKVELGGNWLTKHVLFVIKLLTGETIKRRYSDFLWLRAWLTKIYPGAFIPPLPARIPVAMWPTGYLQTRKRELQVFLKRCAITPFIAAEETWIMYLQPEESTTFEKIRKRWDKDHDVATIRQTCEHLEKTFPNIMNFPLPNLDETALEQRFRAMSTFIGESVKVLQKMLDTAQSLADSFVMKVDAQMTVSESVEEYEKTMKAWSSDEANENKDQVFKVLQKTAAPISRTLNSWCQAMHEVPPQLDSYLVNNIKRNLMDFKVLQDCTGERVKVQKDLQTARNKAAKWKKIEELRSKDVVQKHADELREEELEMFSRILYKLVTTHFIHVWQASQEKFRDQTRKLMIVQAKKNDQLRLIWKSSIDQRKADSFRDLCVSEQYV